MKTTAFKSITALLVLLLLNCGPKLTISTMENVDDYQAYKTYAYLPNTDFDLSSPMSGNNGPVTKNVITAMNRNMQQAGFELDRDNPDLLVVLNAHYDPDKEIKKKTVYANPNKPDGADPLTAYYDPYYYWKYAEFNDVLGYKIIKNNEKRAGLAVELIDRKSEKVIWRASAKEPLDGSGNSKKLDKYVDAVFEEFPSFDD
ncbi:DUF4136 domain-containing protein [Costertonia aggregata]|uniref:DUF4136 domain-containing protein n=1 Tax=Costertonia aggregata TaxID=343403 RepID=A0A7H9ATI7_9FLAO|nr:DUF4136 domain-containing protein [Costertonia aggregata]QLG46515.1 DUF4136 domain-containing protein [Costertonia aggregata]